jgi:hypothetical protein
MSRDTSSHRLTVRQNLDDGPRESFHFDDFCGLPETSARRNIHSERSACMTSTRAARANRKTLIANIPNSDAGSAKCRSLARKGMWDIAELLFSCTCVPLIVL